MKDEGKGEVGVEAADSTTRCGVRVTWLLPQISPKSKSGEAQNPGKFGQTR
jgi:hypothetical protein